MDTVCQTCGHTGFADLLAYCIKCSDFPEHRYCLEKLPHRDEDVHRLCEQCTNRSPKTVLNEKLHLNDEDKDNLEHRERQLSCSDGSPRPEDHYQQNPDITVLHQKLCGPTSDSPNLATEDEDYGHTSSVRTESTNLKKCRLILADDNKLEQLQSDCVGQNVPMKATSLPASNISDPDEVTDRRLQIFSTKTLGRQEAETNDIQSIMNQPFCQAAQPIVHHAWRGCFQIDNGEYGPLYGHISSKACEKVFNTSKVLPPVLCMEEFPRLDAWPNSFKIAPPTDDSIALYFFPESARVAAVVNQLLDEVMTKDLVLKFVFGKIELLVFSSTILPQNHQKFHGEYYLWGVFRGKKDPLPAVKLHSPSKPNEAEEENRTTEVPLGEEKEEEADRCNETITKSSPGTQNASRASKTSELAGEALKADDSCKLQAKKKNKRKNRY